VRGSPGMSKFCPLLSRFPACQPAARALSAQCQCRRERVQQLTGPRCSKADEAWARFPYLVHANRDSFVMSSPWSSASPYLTIVRERAIKYLDWRRRCSHPPLSADGGGLDFEIFERQLKARVINPTGKPVSRDHRLA
jgi:hypothetical protein